MKKTLLSTMFVFAAIAMQAQTIIYVKADGVGNGSSWDNACTLEQAASAATSGAQIWVQKGTHYPSGMLTIANSVKMYGGFSGTETAVEQRNLSANSTIIDAQKKYGSIVRLGVASELNGFVIQNGNSQDNPHKNGGGVWADKNSIIANCIIINNEAYAYGGGVYANGEVDIINTTIEDNTAKNNGCNVFGFCIALEAGDGVSLGAPTPPACALPTITTQPSTIAQSKRQGAAFSALTVAATGDTTLSYQWYSNTANSNMSGTIISGETNASFTPPSTTIGWMYYYCVVTNSCGIARTNVSGLHSVMELILANGCNTATPGFGESLGTVSFKSNKTWTVGGKVWSDVVYAENCNKTGYNGGLSGNYNADCRANSDRAKYGDLFSWCAVNRFEAQLCPDDWRVPTNQEFAALCTSLGLNTAKTGTDQYGDYWQNANSLTVANNLANTWGVTYGGNYDGTLNRQGLGLFCWSLPESNADNGFYFGFLSTGSLRPQAMNIKSNGYTLRCVK